ncbi:MAG: hypothetical protein VB034_06310 [Eubacteriales bacterium]|nr:hypothetical protein [Eubacteriales bacterium]
MSQYSEIELQEAARAISSALMKSEKVLLRLREGSPQYRLTAENIRAFQIAFALIRRKQGDLEAFIFSKEELASTQAAYAKMIAHVEKVLPKFAPGTPQHTLAVRRIRAFGVASALMQAEM